MLHKILTSFISIQHFKKLSLRIRNQIFASPLHNANLITQCHNYTTSSNHLLNNYNTFSLSFYFLYMIVNHFLGRKKDYAFIQKKMLQKILKWIQLLFLPCSILNIEKNRTVQSIGVVEPMVVQLVCLLSLFLCSNRNLLYRSGFTFGLCCSCLFELQTHPHFLFKPTQPHTNLYDM